MATYHATTSSDGVTVTDPDAVEQLIDQYLWHVSTVTVTDDNQFTIFGDGRPDPYRDYTDLSEDDIQAFGRESQRHEDNIRQVLVERAFFWRLTQYIPDAEQLQVRTVGNEKARYVTGEQYRVTSDGVYHRTLSRDEELVLPEDESLTRVENSTSDSPTVQSTTPQD